MSAKAHEYIGLTTTKVKQIDSVKLTPPKYGLILGTKLRIKYDAMGNRVVKKMLRKRQEEIYIQITK